MSGYRRERMGTYLGDLSNVTQGADAGIDADAKAKAELAALYERQAAAAGGAGRAAEAASNRASDAGRKAEAEAAIVADRAAIIAQASDDARRIYSKPNYLKIGVVFGGLGLGAYLLLRRKSKFAGHR